MQEEFREKLTQSALRLDKASRTCYTSAVLRQTSDSTDAGAPPVLSGRPTMWGFDFFLNSFLFGIALAMDAVSVSLAFGMSSRDIGRPSVFAAAGTFGAFQLAMPLIGWASVRFVAEQFSAFQKWTPWIALALLCFLGGKMIYEGLKHKEEDAPQGRLSVRILLLEGLATSIDALSVGFTIDMLPWYQALTEAAIIGLVTFGLCLGAVSVGKAAGAKLRGKAHILGGIILIAIGIEIFVKNFFFGV